MRSVMTTVATALIFAGLASAQAKDVLKPKEVKALVASARTHADHMKLARHFNAVASKHEAEAKEHEELAAEYRKNPTISEYKRPGAPDTAAHCKYYAEHCRKAAKEMREMAAAHEDMAKKAPK